MKKIYFVQANDVYGTVKKSVYIPYATGCIQAYCQKNETVASCYNFGKFIYTKAPFDMVLAQLDNPFMVMFSCSVWNTQYNKELAKKIKKNFPECLILFGGHNISPDGTDLKENDYIDILVHRFGEEPVCRILEALAKGEAISGVPNISLRTENGEIITTEYEPQTATEYPSPYLEGTFDEILKDDISFSALFESNRGCPNSCSFCDWSALKTKVRLFPMERVYAELDWFVKNKIEYIYCVDANFCLFDRDADIADYVVSCKEKHGYPKVFKAFFTKNRFNFVFDVSTRFFNSGLDKAKTISFQSMNPEVLANVGRKNISVDFFRDLMKKYDEMNISTLSELILGLPGETYESFCDGVSSLIENGQHYAINIYPCELLPNSQMGQKQYRETFGIKTTRVPFKLIHSNESDKSDGVTEYSDYITSTYSMSEDDWVRSLIFSNYIQGLHNLGLLRAVAIYCRNEFDINYAVFYNKLLSYSREKEGSLLNLVYSKIEKLCRGIISKENEMVSVCEDYDDILWGFDELIYLEFFKKLKEFYAQVKSFVELEFGKGEIIDALFAYQYDIIKKAGIKDVKITSEYDFYKYFSNIFANSYEPLKKEKTTLELTDENPVNTLVDYAREVVWYGRNRRVPDYTGGNYSLTCYKV